MSLPAPSGANGDLDPIVRAVGLERRYGDLRALGPVSFDIAAGSAVGVLGLNGAGKTTLLRILSGDLRPTSGSVRVAGVDLLDNPLEARSRIGFLPERPPLYREMTVRSFLRFAGRIKGLGRHALAARVESAIVRAGVAEVAHRIVGRLSHGYRQRVGIAQAIVHGPELVILDEPTNGLDPVQVAGMRELIAQLAEESSVVISSHVLSEISKTCDRVIVIHEGKLAADREAELFGPSGGELEDLLKTLVEETKTEKTTT